VTVTKSIRRLAGSFPPARWARRGILDGLARLRFRRDFSRFAAAAGHERLRLRWSEAIPCLTDRTAGTDFDRHYVYHTAWAARVLAETRPPEHLDISSSLFFVAIASAFVPIRFYDYRPADLRLNGLATGAADLLKLPFADASVSSISCMHVVEHVGLGRYGDPLDPDGDLKAMAELRRVVAPGGSLLFVVPVGKPMVRFNAHRIYAHRQIVDAFKPLRLHQFALIPAESSRGGLIIDATEAMADAEDYGCGCFWFRRDS
jgi:SAM-dependent methyltransferase